MKGHSRSVLYLNLRKDHRSVFDALIVPPLVKAGWEVEQAASTEEALRRQPDGQHSVGLALIDADSFSTNSEQINYVCDSTKAMEWVALLPQSPDHQDRVRQLITSVFFDYHMLPPDIERLLVIMGHAYGMGRLRRLEQTANEEWANALDHEQQMVGMSPEMQQVFRDIRKIANVDVPVLITGETGTGKELAAQAIHERSRRAKGPFIPINCASLPSSIIQSELFGHEKGSFTGANQKKIGVIEAASGGTLFLDEIGDLPLDLQVHMLRFLQQQTIQRVGGILEINVDTRVIAATHVDLEKAVMEGKFREDLFFRLNILPLTMPSLRVRTGDIIVLANFFLRKFSFESRARAKGFSQQAIRAMLQHPWPGNVRELINRVRRALVMCEGRLVEPADLGFGSRELVYRPKTLREIRLQAEKGAIQRALEETAYNITQTAKILDISRPALYRLIEKYRIYKDATGNKRIH